MDVTLLQQATAQAKTSWLKQALTNLLPQVWNLTTQTPGWQDVASNWAQQINLLFEQKKLFLPGQQKNRRTDIANALRTIDPDHPVIPFVLLPSEVYTALNNEQAHRLNARENKFFSTQQANELVDRAIALLDSQDPNEIAAGLAVLVGRRISEILISQFKPKTSYSLLFSEVVKRRGEDSLEFEIPTLAPAEKVLTAIQQLNQVWSIDDLKALNLPDNHLKRRINARYSKVPHACRKHFADLVPGREAQTDTGERLYTHLFRAIYAEIATYYYKPHWVPDHRFKAEIQGHFKFTKDEQKIPNYSARQSYDDYLIRDRLSGKPGVKLGTPGVQILEVFQKEARHTVIAEVRGVSQQLEAKTINALLYRTVNRLLFSKHWVEVITGLLLVTGRTIKTLLKTSLQEKSQFSILVDGLEVPTLTGATQVITAWKKLTQLSPLPEAELETAIQEVCDRNFGDLLSLQSVQDLRAIYTVIASYWFCPPKVEQKAFFTAIGAAEPKGFETVHHDRGIKLHSRNAPALDLLQKQQEEHMTDEPMENLESIEVITLPVPPVALTNPELELKSRHRRKTLSINTDLLKQAAAAFGIEIRGKGKTGGLSYEAALAQILFQLAQGRSIAEVQPTPTPALNEGTLSAIKDQAKTLAWLTGRLEALEQQIEQLKQERDQAILQLQHVQENDQVIQLQQENQQLQQERDQAIGKLQTFRQLLMGTTGLQEQPEVAQEKPRQEHTIPSLSTQPTPTIEAEQSKKTRKRIPEEDAFQHIRQAIYAIMAFNDHQAPSFDDKWYISFPIVQTLLRANGLSANQKSVATIFEEMKLELEQHHDKHQLGSRHNRRHPIVDKITQLVTLNP